jgi:pheromone shutdown protein TraB
MDTLEIIALSWLLIVQPTLAVGLVAGYTLGRFNVVLERRS